MASSAAAETTSGSSVGDGCLSPWRTWRIQPLHPSDRMWKCTAIQRQSVTTLPRETQTLSVVASELVARTPTTLMLGVRSGLLDLDHVRIERQTEFDTLRRPRVIEEVPKRPRGRPMYKAAGLRTIITLSLCRGEAARLQRPR